MTLPPAHQEEELAPADDEEEALAQLRDDLEEDGVAELRDELEEDAADVRPG